MSIFNIKNFQKLSPWTLRSSGKGQIWNAFRFQKPWILSKRKFQKAFRHQEIEKQKNLIRSKILWFANDMTSDIGKRRTKLITLSNQSNTTFPTNSPFWKISTQLLCSLCTSKQVPEPWTGSFYNALTCRLTR